MAENHIEHNIEDIANLILAIKIYAHQLHLNFKRYDQHLLADRIADDIFKHLDPLKELWYEQYKPISDAKYSLEGAISVLEEAPSYKDQDEKTQWDFMYLLLKRIIFILQIINEHPASLDTGQNHEIQTLWKDIKIGLYLINGVYPRDGNKQ